MQTQTHTKVNLYVIASLLVLSTIVPLLQSVIVGAAALSQVEVRFDRMGINNQTTGTVCAKPTTTATEASVQVTFPTGYTVNATPANHTVSTTNLAWPSGAVAWVGINTASAVSGQTVTYPSGELTVGTLYCFNWTGATSVAVKSSASATNVGTVTTRTSAPADIDSADYATASISDDQIVVTASVPSVFSFALSGNTDALGTLSTSSVVSSPTPRTVTVNTNAKNGWQVWAKGGSPGGLNSASASSTISPTTPGTNSTLSAGTSGYNTGVTQTQTGGSGTVSVAAPFVGTATGQGGGLDTTLRSVVSSTGTANNAVMTFKNNVAINPTVPAASDYTDTITIIGAGLF